MFLLYSVLVMSNANEPNPLCSNDCSSINQSPGINMLNEALNPLICSKLLYDQTSLAFPILIF